MIEVTDGVRERFWPKVDCSGDCWVWTAGTNVAGYGRLCVSGRAQLAHRVSYVLHKGVQPGELLVCHHCDNPPCVNPAHLFLGTNRDNGQDMSRKGRAADSRGEASAVAKLTAAQVDEMRERRREGETAASIGMRFGVSKGYVYNVVTGRRWPTPDPVHLPTRRLNHERIAGLYMQGLSTIEVARREGCNPATVSRILDTQGIDARSNSDYYQQVEEQTLREACAVPGRRVPQVAEALGLTATQVRRLMRIHGIPSFPVGNPSHLRGSA